MKQTIFTLAQEVFKIMLIGSLIFSLMELIKPGSVLAFLNYFIWLIIWLASAIIIVIFKVKKIAN